MSKIELLHVYVLKNKFRLIKIGIASNVAKHIKNVQTNSGVPIIQHYESPSCLKAAQIEKTAHEHFASHRKFGEWFDISFDKAVDFVKGHFVDQPTELNREFNGIKIRQRASDNYLDATAMCQATEKRWFDYRRLDTTQAFIDALSTKTGIPAMGKNKGLIQSNKGGNDLSNTGTWIHPQV